MGNRFSTLDQYHKMILAHGILAAIVFLFLIPAAVMLVRFYDGRPGWAVRYHARLQIFSSLLILVIFILGFLSVGPNRALTNPHHGIGVAIFVLFILQFIGGAMIKSITKARSLRVTLHQWSGRAIALLGITQIPLGLALYGSPLYLFILYAVWMAILLLIYFILNFRSGMRREYLRQGPPPSEAGHTRVTDSEYFASEHKSSGGGNKLKWLGGLAAAGGLWALVRNRGKNKDRDMERGRSPSLSSISRGRGPEVVASRRGSASYLSDEKFSDLPTQKKSGGGFMKVLGGAAAAVGAGGLVSGFMNRRNSGRQRHNDDYSAVSTETPRRARPGRGFPQSDITSDYTEDISRRDPTATSLLSPTGPTVMAGAISAADSRLGSRDPVTPSRPTRARGFTGGRRGDIEESDYSSYVSPSRRVYDDEPRSGGGGVAKGIMAGLGLGWFGKKMADRKARKEDDRRAREEEQRMRDEEDMRSGITGSRYTGDGHPSPTRKPSRRPPPRRQTGIPPSQVTATEMTESSIDERPPGGIRQVHEPAPKRLSRSHSRNQIHLTSVVMPATTVDPSDVESSYVSTARPASRRRDGDKASTEAAARAASLAATERERYGSPHSQPVSLKLRMHDDRDRNVTLRRLTEEEAREARRSRSHSRADSEVSASDMGSSGYGRGGYRRDSSHRRAEAAAEKKVEAAVAEGDDLGGPPRPAFNKGRPTKPAKDSAYYSGPAPSIPPPPAAQAPLAPSAPPSSHAGPSGMSIAAGQTMSSLASESHGTWSQMTPSPEDKKAESRRNRRRLERRRGSSAARPTGADMYD
jgi:hypothetical protein